MRESGGKQGPAGGTGKSCLSQWWPAAFAVNGVTYATAEHFMMAAKAQLFGDVETAERIQAAPHPRATKALLNLLGFALMEVPHQLWHAHM